MNSMRLKLAIWFAVSCVSATALILVANATKPSEVVSGAALFGLMFLLALYLGRIYAQWRWPEEYRGRRFL